jgi:solute:Na+ symporter, SSS family
MQFTILTVTAFIIGIVAMYKVSPEMIRAAIPAGWTSPFFGLHLGLDWKGILDQANNVIKQDNNELFGIIFGMMFFKGVLASLAGPMPNYDMQRVLATRNTREASLMSWWVNVVLMFPRYFMVAGLTVLALGFYMPTLHSMAKPDLEKLLPDILTSYIPVGVVGLLLAGLIAAFMSNFAATINAAPAYIVNDIYKRFINPNSSPRTDVFLSRVASVAVLVVGIAFGLLTNRIMDVMMWIVGALGGAYVMANVLKWIWWRFNGYGYFVGMMVGIIGAMFVPATVDKIAGYSVNALYSFPIIFIISVIGCLLGTFLSKPEDDAILKNFYKNVRPWGFWGPIKAKVMQEDPSFQPNKDFKRDCANVIVGIVWQLCLVTLPIYLVLRNWHWVGAIFATLVVTSIILKFNWYDKLEKV